METEEKDGLHTVATESLAQAPSSGATISDVLNAAADLIEPEGAWTQGDWAKGKSGRAVDLHGRAAVCWCAWGALERVTGDLASVPLRVLRSVVGGSVPFWNDAPERTQAEVVAVLRKAAELAATQP